MRARMSIVVAAAAAAGLIAGAVAAPSAANAAQRTSKSCVFFCPSQPGQATTGYGSTQHYKSYSLFQKRYDVYDRGSASDGTRYWTYVPRKLKNTTTAPVVVLLHGYFELAPDIYEGMIEHLTRQGNIVVFPQFQKSAISGIVTSDFNQNLFAQRAVAATANALAQPELAGKAELSNITLAGHSLGGLIAATWESFGGVPVKNKVLMNPAADSTGAIPDFVKSLITITPISDYQARTAQSSKPMMILFGDEGGDVQGAESQISDTIAPFQDAVNFYDASAAPASQKRLYVAQTDDWGGSDISADHQGPATDNGALPNFLAGAILGGQLVEDALDYRYYWAGVDAAVAGDAAPTFAMGSWSDGRAVAPVVVKR